MKKLRFLFFLFLSVSLIPLTGCDDDDDDSKIEPSRMELLTASQWTGFAAYANGVDITQALLTWEEPIDVRTWILKFNKDGTYNIKGDIIPSFNGIWEFTNNQQSILFDKNMPEEAETLKINRLTSTELYLDMIIDDPEDGTNMDVEIRFKR